jgi:hypothetical protein
MRANRSRRRFPAFILACSVLASLPATGQTLPEDECARLDDPEAEITCLRAALAATRQAQQAPQPAVPATPGAAPANQAVPAAAAAAAAVAAEQTAAPSARPEPDLGSEQLARATSVERVEEDQERLVSTVSDFRTDRNGRLIMQLENGQIWRQVESVAVPVRFNAEDRVRVEITRSGFGGYRMSFPDLDRRISVSRER